MTPTLDALWAALAAAQAEMSAARMDRRNTYYNANYATLASVIEASRPALTRHGLAVSQAVSIEGRDVIITTTIGHKSGQYVSSALRATARELPRKGDKGQPTSTDQPLSVQALGSTITYLRRYAYAAMVGVVADEDADGEEQHRGRQDQDREPDDDERRPARLAADVARAIDEATTPEELTAAGRMIRDVAPADHPALIERGRGKRAVLAAAAAVVAEPDPQPTHTDGVPE